MDVLDSSTINDDDKLVLSRIVEGKPLNFSATTKNIKKYILDAVDYDVVDNSTVVIKDSIVMLGKIQPALIYDNSLQTIALGDLAVKSKKDLNLKAMSHYDLSSMYEDEYLQLDEKPTSTLFFTERILSSIVVFYPNSGRFTNTTAAKIVREILFGELIGSFPEVVKDNAIFNGWFTAADGGSLVHSTYIPKNDIALYAQYTDIQYVTATFDANGGIISGTDSDIAYKTIEKDAKIGQLPIAEKQNAKFLGWFTAKTDGAQINEDEEVSNDISCYAHYNLFITISFDAMGGLPLPASISILSGEEIGQLPKPSIEGASLSGWFTGALSGEQISTDTIPLSSTTYYALYVIELKFDPMGGTPLPNNISILLGKEIEQLPEVEKDSNTLRGWFTKRYSGGEQISTDTIPKKSTTYYAQWKKVQTYAIVILDPMGGILQTTEKAVIVGDAIGELPVPEKEGYTFVGWFTAPEDGEEVDEDTYVVSEDITIYALYDIYQIE